MSYIPVTITGKVEVTDLELVIDPECIPMEDGTYKVILQNSRPQSIEVEFSNEVYASVCDQVRRWVKEHRSD